MPFQVSPGVNVSEIDLTTVVPAISTTEAGIAMQAVWGPAEKRVLIDSEDTLVATFNKPNSTTAVDFFTAANFLAYANALWVVRAIASNTTGSSAGNCAQNAQTASKTDVLIKNEDEYELKYTSGISGAGPWAARYPGALGNSLKVSICPSADAWEKTLSETANVENGSATVKMSADTFDVETSNGDILVIGADGGEKTTVKILNDTVPGQGTWITLTETYPNANADLQKVVRRWEYFNEFDNAPGTSDYVTQRGGSNDEMHIVVVDEDGKFSGVKGTVLERFQNVSKATDAKNEDGSGNYYKNIINQKSKYIWWTGAPNVNNVDNDATTVFAPGLNDRKIENNKKSFTLGKDGEAAKDAAKINAYNLFADQETVDVSFLLGSDANQTVATHLINNIAENRKDCIAVISPEKADVVDNSGFPGAEMEDIITFRDSLPSTSYAVMDSGWKYQYDKYNDIYRHIPLNGDTAGLMVRTDLTRDPWWSPAGHNRGHIKNVIKLSYNPSARTQRDQLYKKSVNPVVTFPGQGTILFGDKTLLAKPSAFDRINVRRLFIVLEKAISTAAKYTLFEFNDEFTRSQFVNLVEPFLRDVQGRRGIFDFRVVCDTTNNTPEVIDRNEFIGDIYIKPNRSINFIQLNFVAVRTGVDFEEIVGQF